MAALPKNTRASSVLMCEACGAEAQLLGGVDGPDGPDQVEMWNRDHANCGVDPVVDAWQSLADGGDIQTMVDHGDDLRNLTAIPRPSWAPVERDSIRGTSWASAYRSRPAAVALTRHGAEDCDDGRRLMSRFEVSAKRLGQGDRLVGITVSTVIVSAWKTVGVNMTLDEARHLVRVIEAAIDLAVTE
ncbi:hypothetical protein [Gordonia hongkongensis]|uniref:hypothetical protein n=1 Tax=Gordonia hongkongensis TaxID=1701090 RepID=UPI003D737EA7